MSLGICIWKELWNYQFWGSRLNQKTGKNNYNWRKSIFNKKISSFGKLAIFMGEWTSWKLGWSIVSRMIIILSRKMKRSRFETNSIKSKKTKKLIIPWKEPFMRKWNRNNPSTKNSKPKNKSQSKSRKRSSNRYIKTMTISTRSWLHHSLQTTKTTFHLFKENKGKFIQPQPITKSDHLNWGSPKWRIWISESSSSKVII